MGSCEPGSSSDVVSRPLSSLDVETSLVVVSEAAEVTESVLSSALGTDVVEMPSGVVGKLREEISPRCSADVTISLTFAAADVNVTAMGWLATSVLSVVTSVDSSPSAAVLDVEPLTEGSSLRTDACVLMSVPAEVSGSKLVLPGCLTVVRVSANLSSVDKEDDDDVPTGESDNDIGDDDVSCGTGVVSTACEVTGSTLFEEASEDEDEKLSSGGGEAVSEAVEVLKVTAVCATLRPSPEETRPKHRTS